MFINIHIASFQSVAVKQIITDGYMQTFQDEEIGFVLNRTRCVEIDGRYYPVAIDCPENGYGVWTNVQTAEEIAHEQKVLALPQDLRDYAFPGFMTKAERITQKQIEDAEALARAEAKEV